MAQSGSEGLGREDLGNRAGGLEVGRGWARVGGVEVGRGLWAQWTSWPAITKLCFAKSALEGLSFGSLHRQDATSALKSSDQLAASLRVGGGLDAKGPSNQTTSVESSRVKGPWCSGEGGRWLVERLRASLASGTRGQRRDWVHAARAQPYFSAAHTPYCSPRRNQKDGAHRMHVRIGRFPLGQLNGSDPERPHVRLPSAAIKQEMALRDEHTG